MKKMSWIFIILVFSIVSCKSEKIVNFTQESVVVGSQSVQLTFSSEQPSFGGIIALPTNLVLENQSDQPIYLPWGTDPGFNLIIVGLDSTYRTIFGKIPPTPEVGIADYLPIQPGEKIITEFPLPTMPEPGRYNVCAEILLFGNSDIDQIYNVEFSTLKPQICIEVLYE